MTRSLRAGLLVLISLPTAGCGLLPTDKPPKTGGYWFPDRSQPKWNRILFGTRWIPEGPPPPQLDYQRTSLPAPNGAQTRDSSPSH